MFADSMLEISWAERGRRSCTTLTSFGLQAVIIGLLLLIPLLTTVGLPSARTVSTPISMGRPDPGPAPQSRTPTTGVVQIVPVVSRLMLPGRVPHGIPKGDDVPTLNVGIGDPTLNIGNYIGSGVGLPVSISGSRVVLPTVAPNPPVRKFRTSSMLEGSLIRRVQPTYPPLARSARIQGPVILEAIISKAGTIDNLRVVSGHPMLVGAAIEAVSQWRYRPYILNGEAVEVETQITVNFVLGGQ